MLLALIPLLLRFVRGCSEGCLSCVAGSCILCDPTSTFNFEGVCKPLSLENCKLISSTGECSYCQRGYSLSGGGCVAESGRGDCKLYVGTSRCGNCKRGNFYWDFFCDSVFRSIPNCEEYQGNKMCERCSLGYYPNQNKTECLPTPSDESNCSAFGTVRCVRCPAGFFLDPDASFKRLVSASRTAEEIYLATTGRQPLASPPACMPIEIANCETGTAASNCTKCISGFELASTGRCIPVQLPSVVKCASYGRDGGCLTCITGYHPVSSNNCTANDPIPNCASYSTSSRHTDCLRCESGYLVSNTNVCEASSTPVPTNCAETNPRTGECVTCAAGFALASDRSCVTAVEGCASYSPAGCTACGRRR